jgi:hypothetical protein
LGTHKALWVQLFGAELTNSIGLDRLDHGVSKGVDEETKAVAGGEAMSI